MLRRTALRRKTPMKRAALAKRSKAERKRIETDLDGLWREIIRKMYDYQCAVCGRKYKIQAHHLITRRRKGLRWNPMNGMLLCPGHHRLDPNLSAHGEPLAFSHWLIEHRPDLWMWCNAFHNVPVKPPDRAEHKAWLEELLAMTREQILEAIK